MVPVVKKYPEIARKLIQDTKINGATRFLPQEIIELSPLMSENPDVVKELLNVTTNYLGTMVPRFKGQEVVSLVPVMKKYPEIVRYLIKEKAISCNGHIIDRFIPGAILKYAPVIKREPNFAKYVIRYR